MKRDASCRRVVYQIAPAKNLSVPAYNVAAGHSRRGSLRRVYRYRGEPCSAGDRENESILAKIIHDFASPVLVLVERVCASSDLVLFVNKEVSFGQIVNQMS